MSSTQQPEDFLGSTSPSLTQTVNTAALTITAVNQSKVYGAAIPALTATYSGFVNGDNSASLTTQPTLSTTATSSSHVSGSPYTITASGAVDSSYTITYVAGSLTVTTAGLTITANSQTKAYGAASPALTASYSGFVNGDTSASLTTQPTLTTTASSSSQVSGSPYTITASGAADPNYSISYATETLTITQAALTITADNQTMVYGSALPTLTASYQGFVNGGTPANLSTLPALSTIASSTGNTGKYEITVGGAVDSNYTIAYVNGTLSITPAILIVAANDLTRPPNEANPPLTYAFSGFENGDTQSVITGAPVLSTTATINSPPGQYPISVAVGTLTAANYNFTTVGGTLRVAATSPISIGPATLPAGTVGDAYSQQLTASGGSRTGYSFVATGLPPGLSLSTTGLLSGKPTNAAGSPFTVDVTVTDSAGGMGSQTCALTVNASSIYGVIVNSLAKSYYGQEVTLTATFYATPSGSASMTGSVAFYDRNTYLGTEPFIPTGDPSGTASLPIASLAVGNHIITAIYSGDTNYPAATVEAPVSVDVIQAVTNTTLSAAAGSQGMTLTANVVATSPGNPPVVGTVAFCDGSTLLGTEPVTNGFATLTIGSLSAGSHSFSAVFSNGGNLSSSSSSSLVVTTDGPQVKRVNRYGFHWQPTFLDLYFNSPLEAVSAENAANYAIAGPSRRRSKAGDRIVVRKAIYDSASHTVTLIPAGRLNIHKRYTLTVNGESPSGLRGASGVLLDGAGAGESGTNYQTSITFQNLAGRASKLPTIASIPSAERHLAQPRSIAYPDPTS